MRIGIDLGGTKIEIAVLDEANDIVLRRRVPTPTRSYEATVRAIVDLVLQVEQDVGARCTVGVATPGALSPATGRMKNANSTCLNGERLDVDLRTGLEREVRLANDANCFTLSETADGAAEGASVVFGVIIGTGAGGGVCVNGQLLTGPNAIAGEWGHNPLPWPGTEERPGPPCYCGKTGCIETFLSGPGLLRAYAHRANLPAPPLRAEVVVERALAGEEHAESALAEYEDRLARALASVINVLDPDAIVLGGGLSNLARLYVNVPKRWGAYVFSDSVRTKLVPPAHGDSSGVRGAAWLWPQ